MLAMKMRAGRGSRDRLDINFLVKRCGITSVAEALQLYEEFFPKTRFQIERFRCSTKPSRRLVPSARDFVGSRGSAYGA